MKVNSIKAKIRRRASELGHDLGTFRRTLGGYRIICVKCRRDARIRDHRFRDVTAGFTFGGAIVEDRCQEN